MKRDKIGKWHSALSLAVVALTLALGSCTKESIGISMPSGDGMEVRVTFPRSEVTRAVGDTEIELAENRLDRVTILVFSSDGTLETVFSEDVTSANTSLPITQPKWETEQTLIVNPVITPENPKKIYAIANWDKTDFEKATYTETNLKEELTTITAVAELNDVANVPMLMSGSAEVANLAAQFYNVTMNMKRQVSKISAQITIAKEVQNYMAQIKWQTEQVKITVANVPNKSYVVERDASPTNVSLLSSTAIAVDDTKPATGDQEAPATKDLIWKERVYIHENPVTGNTQAAEDASTYIIVQLPYENRITGKIVTGNYYKLPVNDKQDAASPYKVLRNTIYNFNINIKGMGLPLNDLINNVEGELTVTDWEKSEMGDVEAPQNYFNIDRTRIGLQSFESSLQSTIATDVADWKLVKEDGTTVVSFAESKTKDIEGITYTLSGTASAATVTVSKPTTSTSFTTQKMCFIAKNLKVPFTVVYDNGFIPNSVLSADFTLYGSPFPGWPKSELPPHGLQVAMRGDKMLPGGAVGADDPLMQWKTMDTSTPGTNQNLGKGESSTVAMKGAEHPAAEYCRKMGEGWFLPSVAELKLIYTLTTTSTTSPYKLGESYTFPLEFYWTSVENDTDKSKSWHVNFKSGDTFTESDPKTTRKRVRCVKAI